MKVRVGLPLTGGQLVAAARKLGYSVLFSANAFASIYPPSHDRAGEFRRFRRPDPQQLDGLDAALDSAGFVAASHYGDYRWGVADYIDLAASYPWTWYASMDMSVEPEIAEDRPLRILRIATTAALLFQCVREAKRRGLKPPMPVLQGWTADEYLLCTQWLPFEWPSLVGLGSMCRRAVEGSNGILAILDAVDRVLPPHVQFHLFGVKSTVLDRIAHHPRVAAMDSMAWDVRARCERRTGRDMAFRISHMQRFASEQQRIADAPAHARGGLQRSLFDPAEFGGFSDTEALALEALALQYADLLLTCDIEYRDAVWESMKDGATVIAMLRNGGLNERTLARLDEEVLAGLGECIDELLSKEGRALRAPWPIAA